MQRRAAPGLEQVWTNPKSSRSKKWQTRWQRFRQFFLRALPFALGVLATFVGLLLYNAIFPGPAPLTTNDVEQTVAQTLASATPPPANSAIVYQQILPSLVLVESQNGKGDQASGSLGSGVVVTNTGDILTSLHVVDGADEIRVTFADGTQSPAVIAASQPENDIALLTPLQPTELIIPAVLGNPNAMHVGDVAYAVGNPFGLYGSMSAGVISGFNRNFQSEDHTKKLSGLIQVDAAVNPGNSGGPLLNRDGQVVGIVVGILNPTDQEVFVGIGFAVPITTAVQAGGGELPY